MLHSWYTGHKTLHALLTDKQDKYEFGLIKACNDPGGFTACAARYSDDARISHAGTFFSLFWSGVNKIRSDKQVMIQVILSICEFQSLKCEHLSVCATLCHIKVYVPSCWHFHFLKRESSLLLIYLWFGSHKRSTDITLMASVDVPSL